MAFSKRCLWLATFGALFLPGCSRYEIARLEESDYRQPTPPPLSELEKKEYVRGYNEGWRQYASRWYCKVFPDGRYTTHGAWVQCRKDNSAFQQGFEDGQIEAADVSEDKEMREIFPRARHVQSYEY